MNLLSVIVAAIPWGEVIKQGPKLVDAAAKLYAAVNSRPKTNPRTTQADDNPTLRKEVTALHERFDSLESTNEQQAALIAQMAQQGATLSRWLLVLIAVSALATTLASVSLTIAIITLFR